MQNNRNQTQDTLETTMPNVKTLQPELNIPCIQTGTILKQQQSTADKTKDEQTQCPTHTGRNNPETITRYASPATQDRTQTKHWPTQTHNRPVKNMQLLTAKKKQGKKHVPPPHTHTHKQP